MKIPHPIPYQGSKRWIASTICRCLPRDTETLFEPFAGSAAVTLAAAARGIAKQYVTTDVHAPLVCLWQAIIETPKELVAGYELLWNAQLGRERVFYDEVRRRFNELHEPATFLYLLARCVKAAIRYNARGEFNNSPDNRRRGATPNTMRWHVVHASQLLKSRCRMHCADFQDAISTATPRDVIYMDPPYEGVSKERDARYVRGLGRERFCAVLQEMNRQDLSFIISYDGRTGERRYGEELPSSLNLKRFEVSAGRSTQETLLGRTSETFESIYLSSSLLARLDRIPTRLTHATLAEEHPTLFSNELYGQEAKVAG